MTENQDPLHLVPKNILVKMPNWLGDAVMATPIINDLRKKYPDAKITCLCLESVGELLKGNPSITSILTYKKPNGWIHRAEHHEVIDSLQLGKYDLGVLLTNSFTSAWWLFRGEVQNRIGFARNFRSLLLDIAVPLPKNIETMHLVNTYKEILLPLGIDKSKTAPELFITEEEEAFRNQFFKANGIKEGDIVIGVNPGAAYGEAKCWLPERFQELAKLVLDNPKTFLLFFGDKSSSPLVKKITEDLPSRVIDLSGKTTLRELLALISGCSVFLTNDSGPMHIASALKIPLLALFGSTSEVKTGPYNGGEVIHKHVSCSPCYQRVCPIDFRCMKNITTQEVYQKLVEMTNGWK